MYTLSKLSDKCKKCPHVNNCDNKRMVACALRDQPLMNNVTMPITMSTMQPVLRDKSLQAQMTEKLKKDFYKDIFNINCAFNKS